jgi:hypothetical protein
VCRPRGRPPCWWGGAKKRRRHSSAGAFHVHGGQPRRAHVEYRSQASPAAAGDRCGDRKSASPSLRPRVSDSFVVPVGSDEAGADLELRCRAPHIAGSIRRTASRCASTRTPRRRRYRFSVAPCCGARTAVPEAGCRFPGAAIGRPREDPASTAGRAAGGNHRCGPPVDCVDDLSVVDPSQVGGGDPGVGMPWLALDHERTAPLAGHLYSVGVPELVGVRAGGERRRPRAVRCSWLRIAARAHGRPRVGPRRTQNNARTRQGPAELESGVKLLCRRSSICLYGFCRHHRRCGIASHHRPPARTQLFVSGGCHRSQQIAGDVHGRFASIALGSVITSLT